MLPQLSSPDESTWFKALSLAERSSSFLRQIPLTPQANHARQLGEQRLGRWRSQPQFSIDSIFNQHLDRLGIDEVDLIYLLGEQEDALFQRFPERPAWLAELTAAYAAPATLYVDPAPGEEELGFLELIQPLVDQACRRLSDGLTALTAILPSQPFDPQTIESIFLMNLLDPLLMRLGRTMVLELNVARLQDQLAGATPEDRFKSFIERLRSPENSLALLGDYPVLARQLVLCINQWVEVSLEFLGRLCEDWERIRRSFSPDRDPGILVDLMGGAGDTHRDGRSVMIARFASGLQIVYKPKSMAVDIHFQEFLKWLNVRGCEPTLRTLKILDCSSHGWMEFVEYKECNSLRQVEEFYRRLGAYLAMLYAINASDFHLENLIAAGEHPVLIDLETLFNPEFEPIEGREADLEARRAMLNSVLAAGLLPQRMWSGVDYGGIDISGFGGEAGQMSPDRIPQPDGLGTDEMRYVRERLALSGESNRPSLDGVEINALDHVEQVHTGFRNMYRLLLQHRADLLASEGPLARFANDEVRVLLRPTRTYGQLLFESFHPDVLRDALERDLLFDRLWLAAGVRPYMASVVPVEQKELLQGDIPIFTTFPASLSLESGSGEIIPDVLTASGLTLARRRINQLSDQDMVRQEWFIRASLATLLPYEFGITPAVRTKYRLGNRAPDFDGQAALNGAREIADRLAATVVYGEEDVTWLGLQMLPGGNWDIAPCGMDLYSGVPGITLFLAYAGAALQNTGYTALARRGLSGILRHLDLFKEDLPGIGAFEGWGGTLYVLTNLGVLWNDTVVLSTAEKVAEIIANFVSQDETYDVLGGAAGAIAALLVYNHCRPSTRALAAATACGDHLLASAKVLNEGLAWGPLDSGSLPLTGFAQGTAGIAWALQALAGVTGQERYLVAARQALTYERNLFSHEAGNWPDLRVSDRPGDNAAAKSSYPVAWCQGAAGIGLSRLAAYSVSPDEELQKEIQTALNTTLSAGFDQSHCLCHGDMGNLEFLLQASLLLDDQELQREVLHIGSKILQSMNRSEWYCGGPGGVELPGLMLGIAGIGYQLLRLADPHRTPSILTLAPPVG